MNEIEELKKKIEELEKRIKALEYWSPVSLSEEDFKRWSGMPNPHKHIINDDEAK